MTKDFREKLILTIIDKLIIGLIVVMALYFGNKGLEQYKSNQSLVVEFSKQKIAKIAETWTHIYEWEQAFNELARVN